jgi:hypothetical protein
MSGKMSLPNKKDVRQIVQKYRREFPTIDRPFLRRLIRSEQKLTKDSELKALDRHLKKAFEKPSENAKSSEILEPNPDELSAFMQFPRSSITCSFAEEHLRSHYPEWYQRNKKTFDEMRMGSYGFDGYVTNPH